MTRDTREDWRRRLHARIDELRTCLDSDPHPHDRPYLERALSRLYRALADDFGGCDGTITTHR